jgi:hypothetical protein
VAEGASRSTLGRIASVLPSSEDQRRLEEVLRGLVLRGRCRIVTDAEAAIHPRLLLAATLPDDDVDAFATATAILLADRLQRGGGEDDLYWHWDAFRPHYRLLEAPARAAVFQGYGQAHRAGLVTLDVLPGPADLVTRAPMDVRAILGGMGQGAPAEIVRAALEPGGDPARAAELWRAQGPALLRDPAARPLLSAIRHLYERDYRWRPFADRLFDPAADGPVAPLLPLDTLPQPTGAPDAPSA